MRVFDSHAHIGSPELLGEAGALLERARGAGVVGVMAVGAGYGVSMNAGAVALAEEHDDVWATAGVHPHDAAQWNELAQRAIDGWLNHERVMAVGECGLDYWYEHSPRDAQRECLRGQLRLAHQTKKPLVIHVRPSRDTRDAFEELLAIFDEENADRAGGVIHCFTGDLPFARDCLARGFDISFSGILTFKKDRGLRDVAQALPLDRLLVETDAPLLAPQGFRGKRNEPAWVRLVGETLADLHALRPEQVAEVTTRNAQQLFGLPA